MLQAQEQYLQTQVQTASPGELTLMLFNGCIRFVKQAIACMERQDIAGKHANFVRAQNIVEELQSTLNMEYEISHQLGSLYGFLLTKLSDANVKMDREAANYCVSMLTELRDTWHEALKSLKVGGRQ
jgi:flagellar protein FliS